MQRLFAFLSLILILTLFATSSSLNAVDVNPTATPTATAALSPIISSSNAGMLARAARFGRGYVTGITWAPDSKTLAVATSVGVWLYDANNFDSPPRQITTDYTIGVWFSPDSKRLASNIGQLIELYDITTSELIGLLPGGTSAAVFTTDWSTLYTSSQDQTRLWQVATGQLMLDPDNRYINDNAEVTFSPDGTYLAYSDDDQIPVLIRVATGRHFSTFERSPNAGGLRSLAFSPDGRVLAGGSGVWEGSGAGDPEMGNSVQAWDVVTGKLIFGVQDHGLRVGGIAFSPNGKVIASGSDDGTIRLRDPQTGQPRLTLPGGKYLAFSPDSARIATNSRTEGTIRVYNVTTGDTLAILGVFGSPLYHGQRRSVAR